VIRILLIDDHPALRAGLHTVLRGEPGLVPVGAVASAHEALRELERLRPDLVLVDFHLPDESGLLLCRRIKAAAEPPRVLIYSAYADAALAIAAIVAGADGIASKSTDAHELFEAIRLIFRGKTVMPPVPRELLDSATAELSPEELPVFGLLMDRTPPAEIARTLGLHERDVVEQTRAIIGKLQPKAPGG
jgi:DNA-binding NarL/FixJ family response regulator